MLVSASVRLLELRRPVLGGQVRDADRLVIADGLSRQGPWRASYWMSSTRSASLSVNTGVSMRPEACTSEIAAISQPSRVSTARSTIRCQVRTGVSSPSSWRATVARFSATEPASPLVAMRPISLPFSASTLSRLGVDVHLGRLRGQPDLLARSEAEVGDRGGGEVDEAPGGRRPATRTRSASSSRPAIGPGPDVAWAGVLRAARCAARSRTGRTATSTSAPTAGSGAPGAAVQRAAGREPHGAVRGARAAVEVEADQPGDVLGRGPAGDLRRRAVLDDAAALDDEQPVGQHHRLERVVGDEQDRPGEVGEVPAQLGADLEPGAGVERGQRLVEQQQPGVGGERAGERDPLRLPAGQLLAACATARARQVEPLELAVGVLAGLACGWRPAGRGPERDVVADGEVREEPVVLEDQADRPLLGAGRRCRSPRRRAPGRRAGCCPR